MGMPMDKLGGITVRIAVLGVVAVIVAGGIVVGLVSSLAPTSYSPVAAEPQKGLFELTPFLNALSGSGTAVNYGAAPKS